MKVKCVIGKARVEFLVTPSSRVTHADMDEVKKDIARGMHAGSCLLADNTVAKWKTLPVARNNQLDLFKR